jgi:hypothetical protein
MDDTSFSTMPTGSFRHTTEAGGIGGSSVLKSLRATQMADTKPFLPAGEYILYPQFSALNANIAGRDNFNNFGLPAGPRLVALCSSREAHAGDGLR